jgi:hypothetical protein
VGADSRCDTVLSTPRYKPEYRNLFVLVLGSEQSKMRQGRYVPSKSKAQMICDTISSTRAYISQLDGEIIRLQVLLNGLMRKRDALQTH